MAGHRHRALRWLAGALLLPLAAAVLMVLLLLWALPAAQPTVLKTESIATEDVERALQLARSHDPRSAIPGVVRQLRLSQHDAELLLNHAATRIRPSRWTLRVGADRLQLKASVRLPDNPFGPWLNLELSAQQTRGLPQLEALTLGRLALPPALVTWALERLAARYGFAGDAAALTVQRVRLLPQRVDVLYAWGADAPSRMLTTLLPEKERERLQVHASHLAALTASARPRSEVPLSQLMGPIFELARSRSEAGQDAAAENRAALLVLGMVANGVSLGTLLPERRAELDARQIRLTLAGRRDSPQHFLISATLAADSGSPLADMIGLYKELTDARSGTGFSFNDMAANRAGSRLGELAVGSPSKLQQRLAGGLTEHDFMPDVSDLPESMNEAEFRRRFGGPGAPAYQRMMSDIEERLGTTPLFR